MNNDYLHLRLHREQVNEALQRADEARHASELPEPPRRSLPGQILDLVRPRGRRTVPVRSATMTA